MGFVRLTCSYCKGQGIFESYGGHGTVNEEACPECNGEGSIVVHAGSIKPYFIAVDPAGSEDGSWKIVWQKMDDGSYNIIGSQKVTSDDDFIISDCRTEITGK